MFFSVSSVSLWWDCFFTTRKLTAHLRYRRSQENCPFVFPPHSSLLTLHSFLCVLCVTLVQTLFHHPLAIARSRHGDHRELPFLGRRPNIYLFFSVSSVSLWWNCSFTTHSLPLVRGTEITENCLIFHARRATPHSFAVFLRALCVLSERSERAVHFFAVAFLCALCVSVVQSIVEKGFGTDFTDYTDFKMVVRRELFAFYLFVFGPLSLIRVIRANMSFAF